MFPLDSEEICDTNTADSISHQIEQRCLAFLKSLMDIGKKSKEHILLCSPRFFLISLGLARYLYYSDYRIQKLSLKENNSI